MFEDVLKHGCKQFAKICIFPKGLLYVFCQKFKFLYRVFFGTLGLGQVFVDFLDRNLTFPDHKNTDLKRLQNLHFSKGVSPWVWLKV